MKPTITDPEAAAIYLENFNQLGEAIMHSGGNPFMVLKRHDEFLRILAENKIKVTAKYDGPEFKEEPTYYVDPKTLITKSKQYEEKEAEAIDKEFRMTEEDYDKIDWNQWMKENSEESKKEKPKEFEVYPYAIYDKDKPKYFLEIYNGEQWKLCSRNDFPFNVPKFGWSSEGHPYTLGEGKIAHESKIDMYTLTNLKRIVDGLNLLNLETLKGLWMV